jgi:hypothetical protein
MNFLAIRSCVLVISKNIEEIKLLLDSFTNIYFIGNYLDSDSYLMESNLSKETLQLQASNFQFSFVISLQNLVKKTTSVKLINLGAQGLFPNKSKALFIEQKQYIKNNIKIINLGYINLPIVRELQRLYKIIRFSRSTSYKTIYFFYNLNFFTLAANFFLKLLSNNTSNLIIVDAPDYLYKNKSIIYKFVLRMLNFFDNFVVINKNLVDLLDIDVNRVSVIEGFLSQVKAPLFHCEIRKNNHNKIKILYTGSLLIGFGIKDLINDFLLYSSHNMELHICGPKNEWDYLKQKPHDRIFYHGYLIGESLEKIYLDCDFFVVPRKPGRKINLYSFPSKIFEYIKYSKPIVCYKLECFDDKWDSILEYAKESIISHINDILISNEYEQYLIKYKVKKNLFVDINPFMKNLSLLVRRIEN